MAHLQFLLDNARRAKEKTLQQLTVEFEQHKHRVEGIFDSFLAELTRSSTSSDPSSPFLVPTPPLSGEENNDESQESALNLTTTSSNCISAQTDHQTIVSAFTPVIPSRLSSSSVQTVAPESHLHDLRDDAHLQTNSHREAETGPDFPVAVKKEIVSEELENILLIHKEEKSTVQRNHIDDQCDINSCDGLCTCEECLQNIAKNSQEIKSEQEDSSVNLLTSQHQDIRTKSVLIYDQQIAQQQPVISTNDISEVSDLVRCCDN